MAEQSRRVSTEEARKFCEGNGDMLFFEASAKDNVNVEEAFKHIAKKAVVK